MKWLNKIDFNDFIFLKLALAVLSIFFVIAVLKYDPGSSNSDKKSFEDMVENWKVINRSDRTTMGTFCYNGYRFLAVASRLTWWDSGANVYSVSQIYDMDGPVMCEEPWFSPDAMLGPDEPEI